MGGSSAWAMTHMSQAASLLSAHIHIHGILSGGSLGKFWGDDEFDDGMNFGFEDMVNRIGKIMIHDFF